MEFNLIESRYMRKILFSDKYGLGLTIAVLEGRKTMTRRIIPGIIQGSVVITDVYNGSITHFAYNEEAASRGDGSAVWTKLVPKYKVGEVVAVAQAYEDCVNEILINQGYKTDIAVMAYQRLAGWDNKMFVRADLMPHQIRITNIHIERLQDISEEDILREGIEKDGDIYSFNDYEGYKTPQLAFKALINRISGKGTWESNPYCFCYEFELIK